MKLPDDPKQRMQVMALIGIGAAIVLLLIYYLVTTPIIESRRRTMDKLDTATHNLEQADSEIARLPRYKAERNELFARIHGVSSQHILHPVFGTYILGVREIIERGALESGFAIDAIRQVGVAGMPIKSGEGYEPFFNTYSVQVSGQAGMDALTAFLRRLETDNPYLALSGITIAAQPDKLERHAITFIVQWPIWVDSSIEPTKEDLDDSAATNRAAAAAAEA